MKTANGQRALFIRLAQILLFAVAILGATKLTLGFSALASPATAAFGFLIVVLV